MSDRQVPPERELTEVEAALAALTPARGRLDRDRLLFEAGRASGRAAIGRLAWPSIAAASLVVAAVEAAALASRPTTRVVERVVVVREPAEALAPVVILSQAPPSREVAPTPSWASASDYERLRRRVLRFGPDALPDPPTIWEPGIAAPEPSGRLLRSEIAKLLNPGDHS